MKPECSLSSPALPILYVTFAAFLSLVYTSVSMLGVSRLDRLVLILR